MNGKSGLLNGHLSDYFSIETHILSTRSADAYKSVDKGSGNAVCLWMLRHPLEVNSSSVQRFLNRISTINNITPLVAEVIQYGIDEAGVTFCVIPPLDGQPVIGATLDPIEVERRFLPCVRIVSQLHAEGVVCGDLCGQSFWVTREGDVRFIGVMGSFDAEASSTAMLPPLETLPFVSPEQKAGSGFEPASDIFALGVLGYYMLSRQFPYEGAAKGMVGSDPLKRISEVMSNPPLWAEEVLERCLKLDPKNRYQSPHELLEAIGEARRRIMSGEEVPATIAMTDTTDTDTKNNSGRPQAVQVHAGAVHKRAIGVSSANIYEEEGNVQAPSSPKSVTSFKIVLLSLTLLVLAYTAYSLLSGISASTGGENVEQNPPVAPSQNVNQGTANGELLASFSRLAESDDPLAHDMLVRYAVNASEVSIRNAAEQAILDRARRLSIMRASEQVRRWLRSLPDNSRPDGYESVLRSLDITLPVEARGTILGKAYSIIPQIALRVAAALAIDSQDISQYRDILSRLIGDSLKLDNAAAKSPLALILASPDLSAELGEDVILRIKEIPDNDLSWLLNILVARNDINMRPIAALAVERNVLEPLSAETLKILRDRSDLTPAISLAIFRAAIGVGDKNDIAVLGSWRDLQSEKVLSAILATSKDKNIIQEAIDTLAGKGLNDEPIASLMKWIHANAWDRRSFLGNFVGIVANLESGGPQLFDESEVRAVFDEVEPFTREPTLIKLLLGYKIPLISKIIIEKYPRMIDIGEALFLLQSQDKQVRIGAIDLLKDTNDIGAMKLIIEAFEKEGDLAIRDMYRNTFWFIKERSPQ